LLKAKFNYIHRVTNGLLDSQVENDLQEIGEFLWDGRASLAG
jgi:hypothetical protein